MFTWPCKTWISILLLLRVILHPDIELGQVLYEYFEIRYGMFLSIIREPLISPKPYEKPSLVIGNVSRFLLIYELANYNGRLFPMASIA